MKVCENMKDLVKILKEQNKTISTMESCTGGAISNEITNIEGVSSVIKFSAVTYSNEFKIKMGVSKDVIDKYSVYSMETANEMSLNISKFADSSYGIGVTGKLNRKDENNPYGENNVIFISIYDRGNNKFYNEKLISSKQTRKENKDLIVKKVIEMLNGIVLK